MKKILLLFILIFVFFIPVAGSAVEPRPLEIEYPSVPEAVTPTTVETELSIYVRYIFNFSIWIAGIIGLGVLIIAGVRYLISAGAPDMLADAKDQIFAALAGLLILFSSWLILTTINPQLKELQKPPPVLPVLHPGVYLCKEEVEIDSVWQRIMGLEANPDALETELPQLKEDIENIKEKCWLVPSSGEIIPEFNDLAKYAYTVPITGEGGLYGAILYDESKYGGSAVVVYHVSEVGVFGYDITAIKPSSVRTFILEEPRPEAYVEIYELIDFNRADTSKKSSHIDVDTIAPSFTIGGQFERVGSVKIEGNLIVIFFKEMDVLDWSSATIIDVIVNTDVNLYDNLMGRWCSELVFDEEEYYPCPKQMVIVGGGIY
jgi:hypothetical protein